MATANFSLDQPYYSTVLFIGNRLTLVVPYIIGVFTSYAVLPRAPFIVQSIYIITKNRSRKRRKLFLYFVKDMTVNCGNTLKLLAKHSLSFFLKHPFTNFSQTWSSNRQTTTLSCYFNRAGGLYGRILNEVVSTDRTQ